METKNVLYAAVGAPVVVARKVSGAVSDQVSTLKGKVGEEKANYSKAAKKTIDAWAVEGEKIVSQVSEKKVVEEISSKVDLDQAKEQVSKLRDQLEDMLATWKTSFRPEKDRGKTEVKASASKASATKASASKASATKASATKASATKAAAKKPAAKTHRHEGFGHKGFGHKDNQSLLNPPFSNEKGPVGPLFSCGCKKYLDRDRGFQVGRCRNPVLDHRLSRETAHHSLRTI